MATLYVKNGGDGSHGAGYDPTSDSWASAHDNLNDVEAHDAGGDEVRVSHLHNKVYTFSVFLSFAGGSTSPMKFISVDDSDGTTYRPGAKESCSNSSYSIYFDNTGSGRFQIFYGIDFQTGNDYRFDCNTVAGFAFHDCTIAQSDTAVSGDLIEIRDDGGLLQFYNVTLEMRADCFIQMNNGTRLEWYGGSLVAPAALTAPDLIFGNSADGGLTAYLEGVDLSGMGTGAAVADIGDLNTKDMWSIELVNCTMPTNFIMNETATPSFAFDPIKLRNCQEASDIRAGFAHENVSGEVKSIEGSSSGGIHRTDGTEIATGTYLTAQYATNALCSKVMPLFHMLGGKYEDDYSSNGSVRIYVASTTALNDSNFWIEAHYQDAATTGKTIMADSADKSNGYRDPLSSGTTLTSDTGSTWMNGSSALSGYNEYYVDCTLSSGADGFVEVWVWAGVASATIYVDTEFDFV